MEELARAVGDRLAGWIVKSATLAAPGALERALASVGPRAVIFPHFMADGWFVREELPRRLSRAGAKRCTIVPPLGVLPGIADLALRHALAGVAATRFGARQTSLLLAAHGSPSDPRPAAVAQRVAQAIAGEQHFAEVVVGFVDEEPFLADAAAHLTHPAVCLPFFAAKNGHVRKDLPNALARASSPIPILEPIGTHGEVPDLIASALSSQWGRVPA